MRKVILIALVAIACGAAPVSASGTRDRTATADQSSDGTTTISVGSEESSSTRRRGGSGITCHYYDTFLTDTDALQFSPNHGSFQDGLFYWVECFSAGGDPLLSRYFRYTAGTPAISPYRLALAARSTLELPFPGPSTNPDRDVQQLVGVDTWLWIDPADWEPVTTSVAIPGISASVTATPVRSEWDMGDGSAVVVCDGPGTPYDTSLPESAQSTECRHLYQVRGAYTATATIVYEITWSASNGEGGTLDAARRSTEFPMTVAERQAIGT